MQEQCYIASAKTFGNKDTTYPTKTGKHVFFLSYFSTGDDFL